MCMNCDLGTEAMMDVARAKIALHGWTVVGIYDADPLVAYTVGLTARGWPELTMRGGQDPRVAQFVLNRTVLQQIEQGRPYEAGEYVDLVNDHGEKQRVLVREYTRSMKLGMVRALYPDLPRRILEVKPTHTH